ncbi:MAG: hypothetical protein MJZ60_08165 [Bacteroidaceae bacterium]|nr:hypothetical protein [Bacteroidaceae bacterium]
MKTKLRIILSILLVVTIVGLLAINIANTAWCIRYERIVAIIVLTLLVAEIFIYCFCGVGGRVSTICKAIVLRCTKIIAEKLDLYNKRLKALQPKQESLDLLSPQIVEKSEYVSILKAAIDNEDVRNVAISGTYGSGKSSIIKTFEMLYPGYKCLNLSLAAFAEELEDNSKATTTADDTEESLVETGSVQMEQLEYSLVQQFFYHVKASRIPDSRFGRIRRWNRYQKTIWSLGILVVAFALYYLAEYDMLIVLMPFLKSCNKDILDYTCILVALVGSFTVAYRIVSLFHRMSGGHIKFMKYEVDMQKDIKISVFNRYLDELVFLFQTTSYQIVVLEDLDRFKNTSIFTKLRELNLLLNQSKDIGRRIVFVYALRDDIFHSSQERTKFFDYIIPVLPHTSVTNSASQFVKEFGQIVGDEEDELALHKSFLNDVAPFIGDLRTIKAIVSDFKITSKRLTPDLKKDNLLAIIIYKNLCPKNFELIYEGKGPIYDTFAKESEFKKKKNQELKKRIDELEIEIAQVGEEKLCSIKELKALVVAAAIKQIPAAYYVCDSRGNQIAYSDLFTDDYIKKILSGELYYREYYYGRTTRISKDALSNALGADFNYDSRKALIVQKSNVEKLRLTLERDSYIHDVDSLVKKTMKEMCEVDDTLLSTQTEDKHTNLLNFLIKRGYIDESYYYYITDIKSEAEEEGLLSQNDNTFLLSIKGIGIPDEDGMSRHIDDPKLLLKFLIPQDFVSNRVLNFDLVHEIMASNDTRRIELLVHKFASHNTQVLDLINRYAFLPTASDGFIQLVAKKYDNLWSDVENDELFSNEAKLNLFQALMKYGDVEDIVRQNEDGLLAEYLRKSYYDVVFNSVQTTKAKQIIKLINVRFASLTDDRSEKNLLDYVYRSDYYEHSSENIWLILKAYSDIDIQNYEHCIYTAIVSAKIEPLLSQIEEDIESFAIRCVLDEGNTMESAESVTLLLNNGNISDDTKRKLIDHNGTIFEDVPGVESNEYKDILFEESKLNPTLANIDYYLEYNSLFAFDSRIIKFININSRQYLVLIKEKAIIEEDKKIIKFMIDTVGIEDDIWKAILSDNKYDEIWSDNVVDLREEQIRYIIDNKLLKFDNELFSAIGAKFSGQYMYLLCKYPDEVSEHLQEFNFTTESLINIAKQPVFQSHITNIYALITADRITNDTIADSYLKYVVRDAPHLAFESLRKSVNISLDDKLKMSAVSAYMQQEFADDENITKVLISMGEPFNQIIENQSEIFELERSPEVYQFFEQLVAHKYASHRGASKSKFKIYIFKKDIN